jgi:hypothetical protein
MGFLAAADTTETAYRLLDPEHDIGPGGFALSPDGQTIAYGGGSTGWLYRWDAGIEPFDPASYGLVGTKGVHLGSPAWSPDGTKLAWVVAGGFAGDGGYRMGIGVFDLEARTAILIHPYVPVGVGAWPPAPAWSPDGRWLAFEAWAREPGQSGVRVVQVDGVGENGRYLGEGSRPVWSPSGEQMAFHHVSRGGERAIWVVESDKQALTRLGLPPDALLVGWTAADMALPTARIPVVESAAAPQIVSFDVAPAEVEPGDVVTLSWKARGDRATICPSARYALFTSDDCWQVPPSGSTTFTIPLETGGNRAIDFLLSVDEAVGQKSVGFKCDTRWFYSDKVEARICPLDPIQSRATAQRFERGAMIWVEQIGRTIVLQERLTGEDGLRRVAYAQDPLDVVADTSASVTAPDGFYAPKSGFGLLWRGDVSGLPGYREVLGWALAPEFGYQTNWQCDDALPSGGRSWQTCYLEGPEGEVIVLDPLDRWYLWGEEQVG